MEPQIREILTSEIFLITWVGLMLLSLGALVVDLKRNNPEIAGLMKWVWVFTVAYSGPIGLAIYFFSGRKQIRRDSLWRRGFRSVAHCYSGCGAGEIIGVVLTLGILSLSTVWVTVVTFILAYVAGFSLTVGPLVQEGVGLRRAFWDALTSETASITVMEITAIGVGLWFSGNATLASPLFWASLVVSLTAGLAAAYPVNLLLIRFGVKSGMHDPREMARHGHGHGHHAHAH